MDRNLVALKPALVWKHFAEIVRIPRPSSHEEKIRKYVMDFAKSRGLECKEDAIDAYIDGGWVTADGTTLGADNGIGVAAILAVLEDRTLKHGPLEALFTATEETGMDGANGL